MEEGRQIKLLEGGGRLGRRYGRVSTDGGQEMVDKSGMFPHARCGTPKGAWDDGGIWSGTTVQLKETTPSTMIRYHKQIVIYIFVLLL